MRCLPQSAKAGATGDFYTKALGCHEITEESLNSELLGTLLARELGARVSDPGLIELREDFVRLANDHEELKRNGIRLRPSKAFGSTVLSQFLATGTITPETDEEFADAACLFAFDLLVQNPDRGGTNLNVTRSNGRLLAFDFEMCFSFTRALPGGPKPYEVDKTGFCERHCFYKSLRGKPSLLDPFLAAFRGLSDERMVALAESAPKEWRGRTPQILNHLMEARRHCDELGSALRRLLT